MKGKGRRVSSHHHDIHARQLGPDLSKDADMSPVDHVGFEQLEVGDIGIVALELAHVLDVLELSGNEGAVRIAFTVDEGQNGMAIFPAVFASQPSRRFGQEKHAEEEADGWDHLKSPWNAESLWSVEEGASVGDAVCCQNTWVCHLSHIGRYSLEHNQNSPGDCPLLRADQASPLTRRSQFRDIHRDLGRANTHTYSIQDPPDNKHPNVLRRGNDNGTHNPDNRTDHDRLFPSQDIRKETGDEGAEPATAGHGGGDAALDVGIRTGAGGRVGGNRARLEIAFVLGRAEDGGHLGYLSVGIVAWLNG